MKTLDLVFTRGDHATQPGGLILRHNEAKGEYITHRFNRLPHTRDPQEFYWGHYFSGPDAEQRAIRDFQTRRSALQDPIIPEGELIAKGDAGFSFTGEWEGTDA